MQDRKDEQDCRINDVETAEGGQAAEDRAKAEQTVQKNKVRLKVKSNLRGGASHHHEC